MPELLSLITLMTKHHSSELLACQHQSLSLTTDHILPVTNREKLHTSNRPASFGEKQKFTFKGVKLQVSWIRRRHLHLFKRFQSKSCSWTIMVFVFKNVQVKKKKLFGVSLTSCLAADLSFLQQ